ncbi:MAG: hypothetical protein ACJ735_11665 [Actinomycetes bacterium]
MTANAAEPTAPGGGGALTGARGKALLTAVILSGLLIVGIWVAFLFAGHGVFGLNHHNLTADKHQLGDQKVLDAHRAIGSILQVVALLLLIAVAIARPVRSLIIWTVVLAVLIIVGQPLLAGIGEDHSWVGGLHVLDGGIILVLSFYVHLALRKVPRA